MVTSSEYPDLRWMSPRSYGSGRDGKAVRYIVIHYTAGAERSTSAEDGAAYDQRRTDGTSTHYFVDSNSIVQCVRTSDRANAARHRGNRLGIQYELCGTAQSRAQWLDAASLPMLQLAAKQVARDCRKYDIPVRRLSVAETRRAWTEFPGGPRGIVGHVDCTRAYPEDGGDHTDPGSEFPWDLFLSMVQDEMENGVSSKDVIEALESAAGQAAVIKALKGWTEENPDSTKTPREQLRVGGLLRMSEQRERNRVDDLKRTLLAVAQAQGVDSAAVTAQLQQLAAAVDQVDEATVARLRQATPQETADLLRAVLGDDAAEVGRILAGAPTE